MAASGLADAGEKVIDYYIERDGQIYLLMVFTKDEQDDLTKDQKKRLEAIS